MARKTFLKGPETKEGEEKEKNEVLILEDGKLWAMSCSWHEGQSYGRLEAWMPGYVFDWSKFKPLCTLISQPLKWRLTTFSVTGYRPLSTPSFPSEIAGRLPWTWVSPQARTPLCLPPWWQSLPWPLIWVWETNMLYKRDCPKLLLLLSSIETCPARFYQNVCFQTPLFL